MVDFFFQAEDGIRDFCLSRGLGDVYKRQDIKKEKIKSLKQMLTLKLLMRYLIILKLLLVF